MELQQLRCLVATAEESSFTRAAARLHVAQPAVSQQIAQLERELGAKLFDRSARRIRLTPEGEAFLPFARSALEATAGGRQAVVALRGILTGQLTIGTVPAPPEALLHKLSEFRERHPAVRLTLRTGHPEELVTGLIAGILDAAVVGVEGDRVPSGPAGQPLPAALAASRFGSEPLVIVAPRGHPLADAAEGALEQLRDEPIVCLRHGSGLRTALETACAAAGFVPDVRAETDDPDQVAALVGHGFGIALLPRSIAERSHHDIVMTALREPGLRRSMVLVWNRDSLRPPAIAFLDLIDAEPLPDESRPRKTRPTA